MTGLGIDNSLTVPIECEFCHEVFVGNDNSERFQVHWDSNHQEPTCPVCSKTFGGAKPEFALGRHLWISHRMRGGRASSEARQEEPAQRESLTDSGEPGPATTVTVSRVPSVPFLPDGLAALEARVAVLEDQYQRLYEMFNIHQRRQDSHQNPQIVLGVH